MKKKVLMAVSVLAVVALATFTGYKTLSPQTTADLMLEENVEALTAGEPGGVKCPNGCSNIGWGINKILECDCNYDHVSCCDRWGC